jgi:hypothetical protein
MDTGSCPGGYRDMGTATVPETGSQQFHYMWAVAYFIPVGDMEEERHEHAPTWNVCNSPA